MHNMSPEEALLHAVRTDSANEVGFLLDGGLRVDVPVWPTSASGVEYRSTALCVAADSNSISCVKLLLARGANPAVGDDSGETPLHLAAESGYVNVMDALIGAGASVEVRNLQGSTPLNKAAHRNQLDALDRLIELGADPSVRVPSLKNATPLHWAASNARFDVIRILVAAGADINARDDAGETPLHWAVISERREVVRRLLELGADPQLEDVGGRVPLHLGVIRHQFEICSSLVLAGADGEYRSAARGVKLLPPFQLAIDKGWLEGVRCIAESSDIDPFGKPPEWYLPDSQSRRDDVATQELLRSLAAARQVRAALDVGSNSVQQVRTRSSGPSPI
jgi:ankyrin repeat protein